MLDKMPQSATTYTSHSPECRADVADLVAAYDRAGFDVADLLAHAICDKRRLSPSEALTLADGFRRAIILR